MSVRKDPNVWSTTGRALVLKKISIGQNVTIASRSVIHGGAVVDDGVLIGPFSMVHFV